MIECSVCTGRAITRALLDTLRAREGEREKGEREKLREQGRRLTAFGRQRKRLSSPVEELRAL